MPKPLNLDDIEIPKEDADKPADIDTSPGGADPGVADDPKDAPKEGDEDNVEEEETEDDKDKEEEKDSPDEKDQTKEGDEEEEEDEEDPDDKELTPFHEHPDWKKMVKSREEDKTLITKLEGQVELLTQQKGLTAEGKEAAVKSADDRIQEDIDNGWEPKDHLELTKRYGQYLRDDIDRQRKEEEKKQAEENNQLEENKKKAGEQINEFFEENKVVSQEDKDLVLEQVIKWRDEGYVPNPTVGTLKLAFQHLKEAGKLGGSQPKPKKKEGEEKKEKEAADKKKKTLKKTSRPKGGDGGGERGDGKKPYSKLAQSSIDDIVTEAAKTLG